MRMRWTLTAMLVTLAAAVLAGCSQKKSEEHADDIGPPAPVADKSDQVQYGDRAWVEYTGRLKDGTEFDSTARHGGEPMEFEVGISPMVRGFTRGVLGMKVGQTKSVVIPPEDGYGKEGNPPTIPPDSTLIFEIKLVRLEKEQPRKPAGPPMHMPPGGWGGGM